MKNQPTQPTVYEAVTARILTALEAGRIPWARPWSTAGAVDPFPRNFRTDVPYRGANVLILWASAYASPYWLTFKQARELGGTVRKGEIGTPILFWKIAGDSKETNESTEPTTEDGESKRRLLCRSYTVFNVEQCDGLQLPASPSPSPQPEIQRDRACEAILTGWEGRPSLRPENEHESRAYYCPDTDSVHMPSISRFVDMPHYYATLFHELIHSTGHPTRLNRSFGKSFGDALYSKEELTAEVGASFLCAITGISNQRTEQNSAAYLQHWIAALKGDARLIITAAAAAQKAVDLIVC
jgi:antirestriction protein ArdC